jgi:hypothetical protein
LEDRKRTKENAAEKLQAAADTTRPGSPTQNEEPRGGTPDLYRPPEPAAQRRKQGLDPVFVITEPFANNYTTGRTTPVSVAAGDPGTNRKYEIYTGSKGKIAEFYPFALQPFTPVDRSGLELLTSTIATSFSETFLEVGVLKPLIETTNGDAFTYAAPVFQHVIDNKLYICIVRASHDWGWNEVFFALYNDTGNAVGTITVLTTTLSTRAKYDLLTVSIDLDTGNVTSSATALYDRTMLANDYIVSNNYAWTTSITYRKLTEAIHETLPTTHPLKVCGPNAWDYLATRYGNGSIPGAALFTSGTYQHTHVNRPPSYNDTNLPGYALAADGDYPNLTVSHLFPVAFTNVRSKFSNNIPTPFNDQLLGYNTKKNTRVIVEAGVMEWAKLPKSESLNLCSGFDRLFLPASNSYDGYTPSSVQARSKYIRPKGLNPVDRAIVVAEPATPAPPNVTPPRESPLSIEAPKYLRQQTDLPSFAPSADALHIAYRIL